MTDRSSTLEDDVTRLTRRLDEPDALRALMADHDFLRSEDEARRYIRSLLVGLGDIGLGRTAPDEQVVRETAARRSRHRAAG